MLLAMLPVHMTSFARHIAVPIAVGHIAASVATVAVGGGEERGKAPPLLCQ